MIDGNYRIAIAGYFQKVKFPYDISKNIFESISTKKINMSHWLTETGITLIAK